MGQEEHSPRRRRRISVRLSVELGNKGTCVAVKMEKRDYLHKEGLTQSGRIMTVGARFLTVREKNDNYGKGEK